MACCRLTSAFELVIFQNLSDQVHLKIMNFLLDSYSKRFHVQDISCWLDKSLQHPSKNFLVKIHSIFQNYQNFENSHDSIDITEDMFSHTLLDITASGFGMQFSKEAVSSLLNLSLSSTSLSHTY